MILCVSAEYVGPKQLIRPDLNKDEPVSEAGATEAVLCGLPIQSLDSGTKHSFRDPRRIERFPVPISARDQRWLSACPSSSNPGTSISSTLFRGAVAFSELQAWGVFPSDRSSGLNDLLQYVPVLQTKIPNVWCTAYSGQLSKLLRYCPVKGRNVALTLRSRPCSERKRCSNSGHCRATISAPENCPDSTTRNGPEGPSLLIRTGSIKLLSFFWLSRSGPAGRSRTAKRQQVSVLD